MKTIYEARCVCGEDVFSDDGKDAVDCGACGRSMCAEMFKQTEVADIISETISPPPMTHDSVSEEQRLNEWNETPSADKVRGLMMRLVEESRKIVDEKDAERFRLYVGSIGLLMVRESVEREQAAAENAARVVLAAVEQANLKITKPEGTEGWYYAATAARSAAAPFLKGK